MVGGERLVLDGVVGVVVRRAVVLQATFDWLPPWVPRPAARVVAAVVILVAGWYLGKLAVALGGRRIARRFQRPSVTRTVIRAIRMGAVVLASFAAATRVYGFEPENIVLSVTVFSAVLGVVLAPIVGSLISGVFVLADQPYEIGDLVELADSGQRGFVEDMTLRYTKIFTLDNTFLVVPNGAMRERDVVNYSAEDERTRLSLDLVVTYEGDLDEARALVERSAARVDEVIEGGPDIRIGSARYPAAPTAYIDAFGDHGVHLRLRYWVKTPYKLLTVRSAVQERAWTALAEADDVTIAYPHQQLVFDETSGTAQVSVESDRSSTDRQGPGPDL